MPSMIHGIHHLAVYCKGSENFDEAIRFYRDVLGCSVARSWMSGETRCAMVDTGAGMLELFSSATAALPAGIFAHLAFATADTDACIAAVRTAGYEILKEPFDIVIPSTLPYPARIAFCRGPAGEEIEFFEEK